MIPIEKLTGRLGNQMFQHAYLYAQTKEGYIPDIYVQSEDYFENCKEDIKALYAQDIPYGVDMVAIHVRRGDYVNNPFYVDLMQTDYYENAMAEFPDETFLVFSDDIPWCRKQPIFKKCEFSTNNTDVEDLNLMAACKGVIIANSSFSWWGGWLSTGKVIAPEVDKWYFDGRERTRCPDSWIRM